MKVTTWGPEFMNGICALQNRIEKGFPFASSVVPAREERTSPSLWRTQQGTIAEAESRPRPGIFRWFLAFTPLRSEAI